MGLNHLSSHTHTPPQGYSAFRAYQGSPYEVLSQPHAPPGCAHATLEHTQTHTQTLVYSHITLSHARSKEGLMCRRQKQTATVLFQPKTGDVYPSLHLCVCVCGCVMREIVCAYIEGQLRWTGGEGGGWWRGPCRQVLSLSPILHVREGTIRSIQFKANATS